MPACGTLLPPMTCVPTTKCHEHLYVYMVFLTEFATNMLADGRNPAFTLEA